MESHVQMPYDEIVGDPEAAFERVAHDRTTISVVRDGEAIAVISPAPIAKTLADLHRALEEASPEDSHSVDVMETRRLLGL